ncbi:MAG: nucleotidyltransferase domain-containing protein [Lachnospiraceae bacterium]|nr:nucleotidyltransferase domain-containing protein [Lachnospiraceae bacterium]MBD5502442.1 nucleotidyltransferase domain-containing protein [Lachnospiraceae bacterium]
MCEDKIKEVMTRFAKEAKRIYGSLIYDVILYGSCARGDYAEDSDVDVMILVDAEQDEIGKMRRQIMDISDQIDLEYDVVLAPVIQNYQLYQQYMPVSRFYQNVQREGVRFA